MNTPVEHATAQAVRERLERIFRELTGAGSAQEDIRTFDFCFHMMDLLEDSDLRALCRLTERPEDADPQQWVGIVYRFLIHASGHIAAAAKLAQVEPVQFHIPQHADDRAPGQ